MCEEINKRWKGKKKRPEGRSINEVIEGRKTEGGGKLPIPGKGGRGGGGLKASRKGLGKMFPYYPHVAMDGGKKGKKQVGHSFHVVRRRWRKEMGTSAEGEVRGLRGIAPQSAVPSAKG